MSDESRSLPGRPSLRFLKLEARRRHAAGEFPTLHEAQLAIAREHGQSSWTVLKELIADRQPDPEGAALEHVRWVTARFAGAGQPDWSAPGAEELGDHFDEPFLERITPGRLVSDLSSMVRGGLRGEVTVVTEHSLFVLARAGAVEIQAVVTAEPPHLVRGMSAHRIGEAITDARVAAPPTDVAGEVPAEAAAVAEETFGELGLPALGLASGGGDGSPWALARGWADLDRGEALSTAHRFPVYTITMLITATAVLRLVADGRVDLDGAVGDGVVRDLLTSNDRYAELGTLIEDVTGQPYPDAVADLVLGPLGMSSSWFPAQWPGAGARAVTGYVLDQEGSFRPAPESVGTVQAATGLWTTVGDLVRFGVGWSSLLPAELAREALRPQVWPHGEAMVAVGLGWRINERLGVAGHGGRARGGSASLAIRLASGRVFVAMTSRSIPIEPVNGRVARAVGGKLGLEA
ncbi:MAG: serine hydrolase domain-containing protein [Streptosporangiaceae bacterium]